MRSLPVTPRPKIPKPEDGPGKLHPLYVQTPQAPDGFVGLDFHFEPVPFGRYHWLKVTIPAISIPGFATDQEAIDYVKRYLSPVLFHEETHVTVAVRVAVAVQQNPQFQRMGAQAMKGAAQEIETYVNSLFDVRTNHGRRPFREERWEAPDNQRIKRAIHWAIRIRLNNEHWFDRRKRWLKGRSDDLLDPKRMEIDTGDYTP